MNKGKSPINILNKRNVRKKESFCERRSNLFNQNNNSINLRFEIEYGNCIFTSEKVTDQQQQFSSSIYPAFDNAYPNKLKGQTAA